MCGTVNDDTLCFWDIRNRMPRKEKIYIFLTSKMTFLLRKERETCHIAEFVYYIQ